MQNALPLSEEVVDLDSLLLDPNNPRFYELQDWEPIPENMYDLESVQNVAYQRLDGTQALEIDALRDSIRTNGYIGAEMMIVRPYHADDSKYVIIEGNRRLAALRGIVQTAVDPLHDELVQSLQRIKVLVYEPTGDAALDRTNEMILQGIRHISGPREWGAYQKANLIVSLHDDQDQGFTEIGQRIGLNARLVGRYYRAFNALRQMVEDDEFGAEATAGLFSLFDEAIKSSSIKTWLGWDEDQLRFTNASRLNVFYTLVTGDPEGERRASLTNPQHMRKFGELITSGKESVLARFLDGELTIDDAARLVKPDPLPVSLRDSVESFLDALSRFPAAKLPDLSQEDLELLDAVADRLRKLKKLYEAVAMAGAQGAGPALLPEAQEDAGTEEGDTP